MFIINKYILCLPLLMFCFTCASATTVELVKDGDPKAVIILSPKPDGIEWPESKRRYFYGYSEHYVEYEFDPETGRYHQPNEFPRRSYQAGDPHPADRHAANELVKHIRLMSGAVLPVVTNGTDIAGKLPVYIGEASDPRLAPRILEETGASDGFALIVRNDAIHLRGGRPVGAQHAAYELLEQIGVRWFEPVQDGRVIPEKKTIKLDVRETFKTPTAELRWLPRTTPRSIVYTIRMKEEHLKQVAKSPYVAPTPSADDNFVLGQTSGWKGDPDMLLESIFYYVPDTLPIADKNGKWAVPPEITPHNLYGYMITDPESDGPKKRIVFTDGNHTEFPGSWIFHSFVEFLLSDDARAATLRRMAEFYVYPMVNPDGRHVMSRVSNPEVVAAGWDNHNRTWDTAGLFSTIDVLTSAMRYDTLCKVDYFIDFHSGFGTPSILTYSDLTEGPFAKAVAERTGKQVVGRNLGSQYISTPAFGLHEDGLNSPRGYTTEPPDWQSLQVGLDRGIGYALALHDVLTGKYGEPDDYVRNPPEAGAARHRRQRNASGLLNAAAASNLQAARKSLDNGDDVNGRNTNGNTALHLAAEQGCKEIAELLVSAGADVSARNNRGWTPLHYAARYWNTDIARLLLENGADINATHEGGDTPLHVAAAYNRADIVELLLKAGATSDIKGRWERTPLDWARRLGYDKITNMLSDSDG